MLLFCSEIALLTIRQLISKMQKMDRESEEHFQALTPLTEAVLDAIATGKLTQKLYDDWCEACFNDWSARQEDLLLAMLPPQ